MKVHESSVPHNNYSNINTTSNPHYAHIVSALNQAIESDNFFALTRTLREFPTFDLLETMDEPEPPLHCATRTGSKELLRFLLTQTTIHPDVFCATAQMEQSVLSIAVTRRDASIVQMFINAGADVNEPDDQTGDTPLILAASLGNVQKIKMLCDAGANLEHADAQNKTALQHALIRGHDAAIRTLIEHGALLDGEHPTGTSTYMAIHHGQSAVLKTLLDFGGNANREKNIVGTTPLMFAAGKKNSVEIMQVLLAAGANIEAKDRRGYTMLMTAAEAGDAKMIRALCAHQKIDVNATSHHQMIPLLPKSIPSGRIPVGSLTINPHQTTRWYSATALMIAVRYNHLEAVEALIEAGARVNARDDQANTVLMYAARLSNPEIVSLLCKHGARTELTCGTGTTAIEIAVRRGDLGVVQALIAAGANVNAVIDQERSTVLMAAVEGSSRAVLSVLVRAGANINVENDVGTTALTLAIDSEKPDFVRDLLVLGAMPNGCRETQKIPILLAATKGRNDIAGMLLEAGAHVNALDADRTSALMRAAAFNHPSMVVYLLASGADRSLRNREGWTALDYAERLGFEESVEILSTQFAKRQRMAMN